MGLDGVYNYSCAQKRHTAKAVNSIIASKAYLSSNEAASCRFNAARRRIHKLDFLSDQVIWRIATRQIKNPILDHWKQSGKNRRRLDFTQPFSYS